MPLVELVALSGPPGIKSLLTLLFVVVVVQVLLSLGRQVRLEMLIVRVSLLCLSIIIGLVGLVCL